MRLNGWRRLVLFVLVLQNRLNSWCSKSEKPCSSCITSSFTKTIGYILRGFLIGEMEVTSLIECTMRCATAVNCLSLNVLANADGSFLCQLNNGLKENAAHQQVIPHGDAEYYGFKEKQLCTGNEKSCDNATPWHAFNQSYFKLVVQRLTFQEALGFCRAEKGDLASISSEKEQSFLNKTFLETNLDGYSNIWVGLNDISEEGVFIWSDGSPVAYIEFAFRQPDNYLGSQNCVALQKSDGLLNDKRCDRPFPFICKANFDSLHHQHTSE